MYKTALILSHMHARAHTQNSTHTYNTHNRVSKCMQIHSNWSCLHPAYLTEPCEPCTLATTKVAVEYSHLYIKI